MMGYFHGLSAKYPGLIELYVAEEMYPHMRQGTGSWADCRGKPCYIMLVRMTNESSLKPSRPELFFSGALHGNERLGPATVAEMAGFLLENYAKDQEVRWLLDTRSIWLAPTTNPYGYAHNTREEQRMDPNRDFPYLQRPEMCMRTMTARAVNELYRERQFRMMVTFHGGMRILSYEWGSNDHVKRPQGTSTEAPDDKAQVAIAKKMQAAAGKDAGGSWWYPMGTMTDTVYPVDGGMEDWSYAASWEPSPNPISVCKPTTYGGYPEERTKYPSEAIRSIVYLVEMDDLKGPPESTLGDSSEVHSISPRDGHISRNMRMSLTAVEMIEPDILFTAVPPTVLRGRISLRFYALGCDHVTQGAVVLVGGACDDRAREVLGRWDGHGFPGATSMSPSSAPAGSVHVLQSLGKSECRGLSIWHRSRARDEKVITVDAAVDLPPGEYCPAVVAWFDQDWAEQGHPDPALPPQSHLVKARVQPRYSSHLSATTWIEASRTKVFLPAPAGVKVAAAPTQPPPTEQPNPVTTVASASQSGVPAAASTAAPKPSDGDTSKTGSQTIQPPLVERVDVACAPLHFHVRQPGAQRGPISDLWKMWAEGKIRGHVSASGKAGVVPGPCSLASPTLDVQTSTAAYFFVRLEVPTGLADGIYRVSLGEFGDLTQTGRVFNMSSLPDGHVGSFAVNRGAASGPALAEAGVVVLRVARVDVATITGRSLVVTYSGAAAKRAAVAQAAAVIPRLTKVAVAPSTVAMACVWREAGASLLKSAATGVLELQEGQSTGWVCHVPQATEIEVRGCCPQQAVDLVPSEEPRIPGTPRVRKQTLYTYPLPAAGCVCSPGDKVEVVVDSLVMKCVLGRGSASVQPVELYDRVCKARRELLTSSSSTSASITIALICGAVLCLLVSYCVVNSSLWSGEQEEEEMELTTAVDEMGLKANKRRRQREARAQSEAIGSSSEGVGQEGGGPASAAE